LRHERPAEFDRLARTGELEPLLEPPPSSGARTAGRIIGTTAVVIGLVLVVMIAYAMLA
jgi:hypothetical protein